MFKVNNRIIRTRCEICSKLTIRTPERRQWGFSGVFIINFERISHLVPVFLLLTLSRQMPAGNLQFCHDKSFFLTNILVQISSPEKLWLEHYPIFYNTNLSSTFSQVNAHFRNLRFHRIFLTL